MLTFKVTTVGASEVLILNEEAKHITPYNPDFERQMVLAESIMHDDRDILHVLAK